MRSCRIMNQEIATNNIIPFRPHEVNPEDQHLWLRRYEDGEHFYPNIPLFKDNAMAIPEGLKRHGRLMGREDMRLQEKKFRKKLLEFYPQLKRDIDKHIKQFYRLAEVADQVQTNRTIAEEKSKSVKLQNNISAILGAGMTLYNPGIGIVMSLCSVVKKFMDHRDTKKKELENVSFIEDKANRLESTAIKLALIVKELVAIAETMFNGACVNFWVCRSLAILKDMYGLVQDPKGLREQVKSESGRRLRQRARELETMLIEETYTQSTDSEILFVTVRENQHEMRQNKRPTTSFPKATTLFS